MQKMKKGICSILFISFLSLCFFSCSKDDEDKKVSSPYTEEQLATLKVLHGTFISQPDVLGMTTEFTFNETFLDKPVIATGHNIYGEKKEYTIHGYCTETIDYNNIREPFTSKHAFYIAPNGVDMLLYHVLSDNNISGTSKPDNYKVVIRNDNQIRMTDTNFPLNGSEYTRK